MAPSYRTAGRMQRIGFVFTLGPGRQPTPGEPRPPGRRVALPAPYTGPPNAAPLRPTGLSWRDPPPWRAGFARTGVLRTLSLLLECVPEQAEHFLAAFDHLLADLLVLSGVALLLERLQHGRTAGVVEVR